MTTKQDREYLAQFAKILLDAWVNVGEPKPLCKCGHEHFEHGFMGCKHATPIAGNTLEKCDCDGYKPKE